MGDFIGGLQLSENLYHEVVRLILAAEFPGVAHSAALIGYGSEVLGFDTVRSTDHEWGPRLLLFLGEDDYAVYRSRIDDTLSVMLPRSFRGYSTHFGPPQADGTRVAVPSESGPVSHKVELHTVKNFFESWLGLDPRQDLRVVDWLVVPSQRLLEVTAGRVFHDGLGELEPVRARLSYYPRDMWLYLLAAQWRRVAQQEAFVGRTAEVNDEFGSRLIAASLVRDLMKLCFLMERRYAPYSKWFGTAFAKLACASTLMPVLEQALAAPGWKEREHWLSRAYEHVARMHNALQITPPLESSVSPYYGRPFLVIWGDRFVEAIEAAITDPEVKALPPKIGSVDQFSDSTDILSYPRMYTKLETFYA